MKSSSLSKSKLARSIALGLMLGTSLYWGGVANAATYYDAAEISGNGGSSATVSYYYTSGSGIPSDPFVYTNYAKVTSSVAAISDQSQVIIKAGAQNYKNTGSGVLTVSASNATLDLTNANISNGIVVTGGANNITIGANTNTITFSGAAAVDKNNITVADYNFEDPATNITDAKTVTVNLGANAGNISSTAGFVTTGEHSITGDISNTTDSVTTGYGSGTGDISNTTGSVTTGDYSGTGDISTTGGSVTTGNHSGTGNISTTTGSVTTGDNSTAGNISNTNGFVTTGAGSTVGNIDGVGGSVKVQGTAGYVKDTNGTNGVTLVNATITGGAGAAGIDSTMAGNVTQSGNNSKITGSTYGISNTKGSVILSGVDKGSATVTGGTEGGIAKTGGNVDLVNEEVTTTGGDGVSDTTGYVSANNTTITGGTNGISKTTGNVSVTNNSSVTGNAGAGITDTAGATGVTLNSATVEGKGGAGIANTTVGSVIQTANNSKITGSTYGIYNTKGSVTLSGVDKGSATVTGGTEGGIAKTGGNVDLVNEEVTTTGGDGVSDTTGYVSANNTTITGGTNGISKTTGNVSVTNNSSVTGNAGAGITDTAGATGVTLNSATVEGKGGAGIANTTVGSVIQTANNSKITGSTYGIYNTKGSVNLSGVDKGSATVTGGTEGGIAKTGGNVELVNEEVTTTGGDGISDTTGYVSANNTTITGGTNGISKTTGNVSVTNNSSVTGTAGAGITDTAGTNGVTLANATVTGGAGAGIANTTGGGVTQTANSAISGTTYGIYKTAGTVSLISTDKTKSTVTGGTGGIYATTGDVRLSNETVTATTGDGIRGVDGAIDLSNTDISATGADGNGITATATIDGVEYKQTGLVNIANSTVTATKNGIDLTNSNGGKVTITDTTVTATKGFGIDATSHKDVTISGVSVTAGTKGIVATTDGSTLNVNTDNTNHSIVAGQVGVEIGGQGSNAYYNGTDALSIEITNGGDEHINAGIYAHDGATSNNPSMTTTITIDGTTAGAKASGVIATTGAKVIFSNTKNVITTATTEGTSVANVDGVYVADADSSVTMDGGAIDISGTNSANGVHAVNGGSASLSNQGDDFSVAATGTGTANGVLADGTDTSVTLKNTNLKNLSSVDGDVTGLNASDSAQIKASFTADDTTTKEINVHATGKGSATAINAVTGADVVATGLEGITATADGTGTATGIYTNGTGSTVTVNTATDTDMGALSTKSAGSAAKGIIAAAGGVNEVYGLTTIDVTGATEATGIAAYDADSANTVTMNSTLKATAANGPATGIIATNTAINTVTGVTDVEDKTTTGDARGIVAAGGVNNVNAEQTETFTGHVAATTASGEADGILAKSTDTGIAANNVGGVTYVDAEGTTSAYGIAASGKDEIPAVNTVTMNSYVKAKSTGTGTVGAVVANNNGHNTVTGATDVTASGSIAPAGSGIFGIGASTNSSNDVTMTGVLSAEATTSGDVYAVLANETSTNTITGTKAASATTPAISATTASGKAYGIAAVKDSTNDVNKDVTDNLGDMTVSSGKGAAYGIMADATDGTKGTTNNVGGLGAMNVTSTSADAYGIDATGGTSEDNKATNNVKMNGEIAVKAATSGNVYAIKADAFSSNTVDGSTDISATTPSGQAVGIGAQDGGTNAVNANATENLGTLTVSTEGGDARGIAAQDSGSTNTVAGLGAITVSGTTVASGIDAYNGGTNIVNHEGDTDRGDITVTSTTTSAYGVSAFTGNGMESTDNKVYGYENIVVTGGADSPFMTQNLEVSGVYATNVNTEKTATNTVVLSGGISATGDVKAGGGNWTYYDKVYGVSADGAGSANDVTMAGNIEAKAGQTNTNYATIAAIDADNSGKNTITGVKNISATEVAGKDATVYGIHSNDSGTNNVNVGATTNMGTLTATIADTDAGKEADAYGIMAENSSQNTVDGLGAITVTGNRTAYGIDAVANSTNKINLEGDTDRGDIVVTANTGAANGVSATGTETGASSNTVYGYNNISVTGATSATGIEATGNDETNTATNTVAMSGALTTKSTTGPSTGITATDYAANTVTGVTNIDVSATESGNVTGITATDATNSVNEGQETYTSYIKATTPSGTATGIAAESTGLQPASNIVAGVTYITAEGSGNANGIQATGNNETNTATNTVNMNGAILATSTDTGTAAGVSAATYADNIVKTATNITASSNFGIAYGVDASDHSSNTVDMTGNLSASSATQGDAYAVRSNDNSTNIVTGTKDIDVANAQGNAYGIDAVKDSTNNVNNTEETKTAEMGSLTVSSDSGAAYGVNADATAGTGTTANYVGGLIKIDVTSTDADAYGVNATGGTSTTNNSLNDVHVTGDITVTATLDWGESASAYGVNADKYGSNTVEGSKNISATATVGDAYAVKASGTEAVNKINETAKSDKGSVTATTDNGAAYAIQATQGGTNTLGGVTSVDAEGTTGAAGIDASTNSANTVAMNGDLTAKSTGTDDANPVYAVNANNSSTNNVTGTKNITATDAYGNAYGINATKGSTNNVNKDVTETLGDMTVSSDNGAAYGITANAFSTTINKPTTNNVGGLGKVTVTSTEDTATGINAAGGNADNLAANNVNLTDDITVEAKTSGDAYGVNADKYGSNTVTGTGATNLSVTSTDGAAIGFKADGTAAVNTATGLKAITVDGTSTSSVVGGLEANNNGVNNVTMDGALTVTGDTEEWVDGVSADSGTSKNTLQGVTDITVKGTGATNGVYGVYAGYGTVSNDVTMNGKISAKGSTKYASGVEAYDGGTNNIQGTVTSIEAEGAAGDVYGVTASDSSTNTIAMSSGLVSANATALAADNEVAAVYADNNGVNNFTGLTTIKATGASTEGGTVNGIEIGGDSTITNDSTLDVTADATGKADAKGLQINDGDNTLPTINSLAATSENGTAKGINADSGTNTVNVTTNVSAEATGSGNAGGVNTTGDAELTTTIDGTLTATAANGDAAAVNADATSTGSSTVTVTGTTTAEAPNGNASVTYNEGTGTVTLNAGGAMSATGNRAGGATDISGGVTTINGGGNTLTVKGKLSSAVAQVANGSTVNLNNITADAQAPDGEAYSIYNAGNGANVNLTGTTIASSTSTNNAADIYYDNDGSAAGADLNVTIDKTSSITGAANAVTDSAANGAINITNAGTWNVTGDSNLNASGASSLTNTGLVDMTKDGTTAEKQVSSKLAVKSLTHNGNLIMDVSPEKVTTGDQIVTTTTSGSGKIQANILASEQDATYKEFLDTALITATGDANGNYSVTNNGDNNLEVGNWTYSLQPMKQADGSTIYHLVNNDLLSNKGKTIVSSVVSPDYWYYETSALYNDINNFNGARKDHDVWAHMVHNKTTLSNFSDQNGADDVDTQYNGVVVGIDKKFSKTAKGSFWGGIMGGYGKASNDFTGGDADLNSAHVGIYGVYRTTTDWYVGSILKYNRYSTDISSTTAAGTTGGVHTSDDLSQTGWGLSVIGGKRFTNNKGWFVEPQLELGYHRISDGDYTLGGSHVNVDAMTSKRVRAGFNVGKTIAYQSGANLDVFAQASMIHEFGGDGQITTYNKYYPNNGTDNLETKFDGTWGLYKFGLNYNTVKGDNGILALTYNQGSHRHSPLGFELSYNWTF